MRRCVTPRPTEEKYPESGDGPQERWRSQGFLWRGTRRHAAPHTRTTSHRQALTDVRGRAELFCILRFTGVVGEELSL